MDWIKRNLYFLIGGVAALALMGWAGWYLYSKLGENNAVREQLTAAYADLNRLNGEKPHPGNRKVNNIQLAKDQQQQIKDLVAKARDYFKPIAAIPDSPKVGSQEFNVALRRMIDQLQKRATNSSVILPPNYSFSFEAQKPKVTYAAGSLEPLAVQLGEVKAISEILFDAKINSLDNIRRVRISADDSSGPTTDYIEKKPVTNELAVLTPYELTFRCFSQELGDTLAGLASSPHGIIVKGINVEPGAAAAAADPSLSGPIAGAASPVFAPGRPAADAEMFARRYGIGAGPRGGGRYGGGGGAAAGGVPLRGLVPPTPAPVYTPPPVAPAAGTPGQPAKGGLQTVLDEKQVRVTLTLDIVKLLPKK